MTRSIHPSTTIEELFNDQCQRLVNYLRRKTNSHQDAEDIAQNAFIRIQAASEKEQISNPKAYLYQTASNILIDMKRRERVHENYLRENGVHAGDESHSLVTEHDLLSPDRIFDATCELAKVEQAIAKLPQQCRQAFLLHRIKGMSYEDIACILDVSVSSVEKYILQSLKQCRKAICR